MLYSWTLGVGKFATLQSLAKAVAEVIETKKNALKIRKFFIRNPLLQTLVQSAILIPQSFKNLKTLK
jgi:hypothetical protein